MKLLVEVSGIKDDEKKPVRKPDTLMKILLEKLGGKQRSEKHRPQSERRRPQRDEKGRWLRKDDTAA
jgi:hypothetical protein